MAREIVRRQEVVQQLMRVFSFLMST